MAKMRWQNTLTLIAGIWLLISPWVVGYSDNTVAMGNAVIFGIAMIIWSIIELSIPRAWEEWLMLIAGIWLIISPWVLRFSTEVRGMWDAVIVGVIAVILALWAYMNMTGRGAARAT